MEMRSTETGAADSANPREFRASATTNANLGGPVSLRGATALWVCANFWNWKENAKVRPLLGAGPLRRWDLCGWRTSPLQRRISCTVDSCVAGSCFFTPENAFVG